VNKEEIYTKTQDPRAVDLLQQTVLARLGTANPVSLQPHVVPVWFLWDGEALWISAFTSTRKVKDLQRNRRCSVLIEPKDPSNSKIQAVLLEGTCELLSEQPFVAEQSERIYEKYMGSEGVKAAEPQSWKSDPENRLVKLVPEKVFLW
jgi:general stress protein 26